MQKPSTHDHVGIWIRWCCAVQMPCVLIEVLEGKFLLSISVCRPCHIKMGMVAVLMIKLL